MSILRFVDTLLLRCLEALQPRKRRPEFLSAVPRNHHEAHPMAPFEWEAFLRDLNHTILGSPDESYGLPPEVIASGWLGYPGATEAQIEEAERRLGAKLPPSYRAFLRASNGWRRATPFIDQLWSTQEIGWFAQRKRGQEWISAWRDGERLGNGPIPRVSDSDYFVYGPDQAEYNLREEYLETALEISDEGDSAVFLLNPQVVTPEGEWEAWFFASWLPGARRYRSFQELMVEELKSLKDMR